MSDVTVYRARHGDRAALAGATVAVIGYGNLGRAVACNLRDSAISVVVGNIDDSYRNVAADDGCEVVAIPDAVASADIVWLLVPDEEIPSVFERDVRPQLRDGAALCFSSGYALAFGLVEPPESVDVLLIAPRMLGDEVRRAYVEGSGFFSYVSVEHDASGQAKRRLLGLADAVGSLRRGAMELSARQEAIIDLLVEQTVGPVLGAAIITAFHAGVDAGLPPEAMVLELYMSGEMSRTFQAFAREGFYKSTKAHGVAAQYGGYVRFGDVDVDELDRVFRATIEDIANGGFARSLQAERDQGYPTMKAVEAMTSGDDPITAAEAAVRQLFRGTRQ